MVKDRTARDAIRAQIFKSKKFHSETVTLFGAKVEVRQPTLRDILKARDSDDKGSAAIDLIIGHCFVPDTNDKVFDDADKDLLLAMPFDDNLLEVSEALNRMTSINVKDEEKNLKKTP